MSDAFSDRLKRLPPRRAPATLAPRALAAAALYAKPWHQRPFWTWSLAAQAGFIAAVALGAAALLWLGQPLAQEPSRLASAAAGRVDAFAPLARALSRILWLARVPLAALIALSAAPAAALTALTAARAARRHS